MPRKTEQLKTDITAASNHYDNNRSARAKELLDLTIAAALTEIAATLKDIQTLLPKSSTPRGK